MSPQVKEPKAQAPIVSAELAVYFDEPREPAWYSALPALIGGLIAGLMIPTLMVAIIAHV